MQISVQRPFQSKERPTKVIKIKILSIKCELKVFYSLPPIWPKGKEIESIERKNGHTIYTVFMINFTSKLMVYYILVLLYKYKHFTINYCVSYPTKLILKEAMRSCNY